MTVLLAEMRHMIHRIRSTRPDPVTEVRVTLAVLERIKAEAGSPDIPIARATVWGVPLVVDETLPPVPGYKVIRGAR